jgi:hypothetical protein
MHNTNSLQLFEQIEKRRDEISANLKLNGISPDQEILDNQQFIQLLKISPRTAQNYRDSGIVTFHKIGSKVYYKMVDILMMLENHKCPAFK